MVSILTKSKSTFNDEFQVLGLDAREDETEDTSKMIRAWIELKEPSDDIQAVIDLKKRLTENEKLRIEIERVHKFYQDSKNEFCAGVTYQILEEAGLT